MNEQAGYSGTPLVKKLGIKEGYHIQVLNPPKKYTDFFDHFPSEISIHGLGIYRQQMDFIHLFVASLKELDEGFSIAKLNLKRNGVLWISWPKKSSGILTEVGKFDVLNYGLENGLVDTKVAAIDNDWSGHKFMYRLEDRNLKNINN